MRRPSEYLHWDNRIYGSTIDRWLSSLMNTFFCIILMKSLQFVGPFFHFWNIARGLHDFKKIQKNILLNLLFTVLDHTDYCLFDVIYICTFSLKKWRWSKNGLHGSWENSGKTSLRSVEKILSSPSLARNRPCVYCQIQTRRARWGGSTVSGKQIRYFHNNNTSFFKFLRGSSSALKNLKYFL